MNYSNTPNILALINPFDALGFASTFPHVIHTTSVAGHPNIVCVLLQSGHCTFKNLLLGFGINANISPFSCFFIFNIFSLYIIYPLFILVCPYILFNMI